MKRLLLDTHAFLWWVEDSPQLSAAARDMIEELENECFLSIVSPWEMAVKASIGKLKLALPIKDYVPQHLAANQFMELPITFQHAARVEYLPLHHRDPFDRLLAVQALEEELILISSDSIFDRYGVLRIW
ncbi:type II toxin-antitoxin system VapC family toxin [Candidatus Electronema sp. JC]|uniref:type II toxin-antitoxin system VapC family toxin n=1 Tax=Candidatus Electronema sp. JC TaxID=3401570 RepID=UPI003B42D398